MDEGFTVDFVLDEGLRLIFGAKISKIPAPCTPPPSFFPPDPRKTFISPSRTTSSCLRRPKNPPQTPSQRPWRPLRLEIHKCKSARVRAAGLSSCTLLWWCRSRQPEVGLLAHPTVGCITVLDVNAHLRSHTFVQAGSMFLMARITSPCLLPLCSRAFSPPGTFAAAVSRVFPRGSLSSPSLPPRFLRDVNHQTHQPEFSPCRHSPVLHFLHVREEGRVARRRLRGREEIFVRRGGDICKHRRRRVQERAHNLVAP